MIGFSFVSLIQLESERGTMKCLWTPVFSSILKVEMYFSYFLSGPCGNFKICDYQAPDNWKMVVLF